MLPRIRWLITLAAVLVMAACAPRVSLRPAKTGAKSYKTRDAEPRKATPRNVATRRAKATPKKVVARRVAEPKPAPKKITAPVEDEEEDDGYGYDEEDDGYAAEPEKPKTRDDFYAFTDVEIKKLSRRNRRFRKLHTQYKVCSKRAARTIQRREKIPEEIAKIRIEGLNRRAERKIAKLRAEQAKLTKEHSKTLTRCTDLESQLTDLLKDFYGNSTVAVR